MAVKKGIRQNKKTVSQSNRNNLPSVRKQNTDPVIAILCADFHLSLRPPVARVSEPDWFEAMKRPLDRIQYLAVKHKARVLCAGDVFDRWNSPPELINFALEHLPSAMVAIPGQHDLPLHSLDDIHKSAFWTLVEAGRILYVKPQDYEFLCPGVVVHSFPWGVPITPPEGDKNCMHLALIHSYIWIDGCSYPKAPKENKLTKAHKMLEGYDVTIFGDNHKGFLATRGKTTVFNCGTLMRRKTDEMEYKPHVGLLHRSGKVEIEYLNTSKDKIEDLRSNFVRNGINMDDFLNELHSLQGSILDFVDAIERVMKQQKTRPEVRRIILMALQMAREPGGGLK